MSGYYLLSYQNKPLGIYNNLYYLMDYLLELLYLPNSNLNILQTKINYFVVNISYPNSTFGFTLKDNKLYLEEDNGKRIVMCQDTLQRFFRIRRKFFEMRKFKRNNQLLQPVKVSSPIITETKKPEINEELLKKEKEQVEKLNKLKYRMKVLEKWNTKFKTDIKIYDNFKKVREENEDFQIPEMFLETWDFFNNNGTSEENFSKYYMRFNSDSDLDIEEIDNILNERLEVDSVDSVDIVDKEN